MIFEMLQVNEVFTVNDTWGRPELSLEVVYIKTAKHHATAALRWQGQWCVNASAKALRIAAGHPISQVK